MFENLRRDAARYEDLGGWHCNAGFWIVAIYRMGAWAHTLPVFLRIPIWVLYRLARIIPYRLLNVTLWAGPRGTRIGAGFCLIHPTDVAIGQGVEIGEDCLVFHDVTIATGPVPGCPKIGRNVDIYVGARVLGGITVGDRSMVGANCVVTKNVPDDSVVLPAPSRVISRKLSPVARASDRQAHPRVDPVPGAGGGAP